jgi:hypothetical protein
MTQNRFDVEETPSIVKERVRVSPKDYNYNVDVTNVRLIVICLNERFQPVSHLYAGCCLYLTPVLAATVPDSYAGCYLYLAPELTVTCI